MIRNDVQSRWAVEARQLAESPDGASWDFVSADVARDSTWSEAVFRLRGTETMRTVTVVRDVFWNAELRRIEMLRQLATQE